MGGGFVVKEVRREAPIRFDSPPEIETAAELQQHWVGAERNGTIPEVVRRNEAFLGRSPVEIFADGP